MPVLAVKRLFKEMHRINAEAIRTHGELDQAGIARLLEAALNDPKLRPLVIIALGEFLAAALDGTVIDVLTW